MQGEDVLAGSGGVIAPSASPSFTRSLCLVALFVVFQALGGLGLEGTPVEITGEVILNGIFSEDTILIRFYIG